MKNVVAELIRLCRETVYRVAIIIKKLVDAGYVFIKSKPNPV